MLLKRVSIVFLKLCQMHQAGPLPGTSGTIWIELLRVLALAYMAASIDDNLYG